LLAVFFNRELSQLSIIQRGMMMSLNEGLKDLLPNVWEKEMMMMMEGRGNNVEGGKK
jgi:hypothetical protein